MLTKPSLGIFGAIWMMAMVMMTIITKPHLYTALAFLKHFH